jgi:AcrR family transcriptional regulator
MGADSTKRNTAFHGTPQVTGTALRGRQAEARRNDAAILAAARAVLMDGPNASIAAVVERAGINAASRYRRFASKADLFSASMRSAERYGVEPLRCCAYRAIDSTRRFGHVRAARRSWQSHLHGTVEHGCLFPLDKVT